MSSNVEKLFASASSLASRILKKQQNKENQVLREGRSPYVSERSMTRLAYYATLLFDYMSNEKPYLDEEFRAENVIDCLCTNRTTLTKVVSYYFGCTFPRFVNKFRVRNAIELFEKDPRIRVSKAARLSGFKSETVFRTAFKMEVGTNPTDLRYRSSFWKERTSKIMGDLWVRALPEDFKPR